MHHEDTGTENEIHCGEVCTDDGSGVMTVMQ